MDLFLIHTYLNIFGLIDPLYIAARAPMVGHINASLEGLTTIRASNAQNILIEQFDLHQDLHTSASYMYMMISRAFGFYLDTICILYLAAIILTFLLAYPSKPLELFLGLLVFNNFLSRCSCK